MKWNPPLISKKSIPAFALAIVASWTGYWYEAQRAHPIPIGDRPHPPSVLAAPGPVSDPCKSLYKVICGKKGDSRDPSGVVRVDSEGEVRTLEIYDQIRQAFPDLNVDQTDEKLVEQIYTPKRLQRIHAAFDWVRSKGEKFIDEQPDRIFSSWEKRILKGRVHRIELDLPPPASKYADEPDLLSKSGVFYERLQDGKTRIRIGGAYLIATDSWFNLLFTLAHELGHAIDPCELKASGFSFPAYGRLSSCFLKQGVVNTRKDRRECGENDQLSEAFADWFAVQLTSKALLKLSTEFDRVNLRASIRNTVRDLCEFDDPADEADTEFHPPPKVRIDAIFGKNPVVRELLGCGPSPLAATPYCGLD